MDTIALRHRYMLLPLFLLLLCLFIPGCEPKSGTTSPTPKPTPEESLEQIVHYLQRNIETPFFDQSVGVGNNEISTLIQSSTVTHELLEPNEDRETYTAQIIIETSQSYASKKLNSANDPSGSEETKKTPEFGTGLSGDGQEQMFGLSDDSADLLGLHPNGTKANTFEATAEDPSKAPVIRRTEGTWKDIVQLKYEKDQWVLASEIETDWLRNHMERALDLARFNLMK